MCDYLQEYFHPVLLILEMRAKVFPLAMDLHYTSTIQNASEGKRKVNFNKTEELPVNVFVSFKHYKQLL